MSDSAHGGDLEWVKGYTKKDGTKVDGFYRTRKKGAGSTTSEGFDAASGSTPTSTPAVKPGAGLPIGWDDMGSSAKDLWVERNGWPDTKLEVYAGSLEVGDRFEDEWGNDQEVTGIESNKQYIYVRTAGGRHVFHRGNTVKANKSRPTPSPAPTPPPEPRAPTDKVNAGLAALRQQRASSQCPKCGQYAGTSHSCPATGPDPEPPVEAGWRAATEAEQAAWLSGEFKPKRSRLVPGRGLVIPDDGDEDSGPGRCPDCGMPVATGAAGHTCPTREETDGSSAGEDTGWRRGKAGDLHVGQTVGFDDGESFSITATSLDEKGQIHLYDEDGDWRASAPVDQDVDVLPVRCPACGQFADDNHTCDPAAAREGYERFFVEVDPDDDALIEYAEQAPWYHGPDPDSFFDRIEASGDAYEARGRLIDAMEAELVAAEEGKGQEKCPECGEFMGANHLCERLGPHEPGAKEIRACREVDGSVESWNPDYQESWQEPQFYTLYEADKTGLMMAVDDYDTLAAAQSAMHPRCTDCGEPETQGHTCKPIADRPGANRDQEIVALEYASEAIADRLDEARRHPEMYSPEDLEHLKDKHAQLVNRQTYLNALANAPVDERLQTLYSQQRESQRQTEYVALDAMREVARDLHPDAAYFTLEDSDQGRYMVAGRIYDAEGRELELDEEYAFSDNTDHLASFMSWDDADNDGPWAEQRVRDEDLPEQLRANKSHMENVIKIDKGEDQ